MSRMTFDDFLRRKDQRDADSMKVGELSVPGGMTLEARTPGRQAVLELYGEMQAADTPLDMLEVGKHALYAVCPQLRSKELQDALGTAEDPMSVVDALFSAPEQDLLGGRALRFLGLIPETVSADGATPDAGAETVKN